jgi:cytochrome P450
MNLTECLNYYFIHLVWVEIFNFPFEDSLEELKRYFREYDTFITNQQKALIKFPYWMPIPYFKRAMNAKDELRLFAKRALSKTQEGSLTNFISVMKMGHYPEDQIIDQILTAFIGGNESSYNSTQFTFLLLRDHPEFLSKLVTEISVNPNLTNFTDIDALPYLDAVIKESLRLYPTIPLFPRVAKSEDQLDDYILQKGDMIAMSPWTMHRAEKYWPKALEFKPERFFEKNFEREFIYFPFALGPRKCIGAAMATVNMKTFIYHLIQDYTFSIGGPSLKNIIHKVSLVPAGDLSLFDITKK